jgi:hypothetical protein
MSRLEQARALIRAASVTAFEGSWYDTDDGRTRQGTIGAEELARSLAYVIDLKPGGAAKPVGSKIGGAPDLPPGWKAPRGWKGFQFYLQLDLAELAPLDRDERLPRTGLLTWFQHESKGECRLLYHPNPAELVPAAKVPAFEGKARALTFRPRLVVYANEGDAYDYEEGVSAIPADVRAQVEALYGCAFSGDEGDFRLFGRPIQWQGEDEDFDDEDFDEEEDADEEDDDDEETPAKEPKDTVLLLHTELDDAALHVWIDAAALKAGSVDGAWETFSTT